jgi:predicted HTH domain antitoxin
MTELKIPVDNSILISLKETKNGFIKLIREISALKLYKLGKLSLGKAAELAGYNKIDYINKLHIDGETIFEYSDSDAYDIITESKKLEEILK